MKPLAGHLVDADLHEHAGARLRKGEKTGLRRFVRAIIFLDAQGRYPLLFAFGLCAGAAWYISVWIEPALYPLIAAFFVNVTLVTIVMQRITVPPLVLALMTVTVGVFGGALSGKLATLRVSHSIVGQTIGPVMLEGWVEDVEPARRGVRLRLLVHAIDNLPQSALPDRVRVTHTTRLQVEAGRFVRCWVVLRPPPGPIVKGDYAFDRQAYFEGLGAVGYVQGRCRGGALGEPQAGPDRGALWIAQQRRNLAHHVHQAAGTRAGGFAAALASGDRSFMASTDQEALRGSGLAHLLAISGLHMGIVGGLVYLMVWRVLALIEPIALRIPVQKPAAVAALFASLIYLVLSGASISTQRAFIMAAVLFGAILVDRSALSLRSLSIAMIIVVILSPWSVLTPGFQMSFAATGALIAAYEAWQRGRRKSGRSTGKGVGFWLKSLVVTSLVSGIATMPYALYHFDRVAGLGLVANLMAMPIISLVSAPLAGASLVLAPFGLSDAPLRLFGYSLEAVLWIAHTFNGALPGGVSIGKPMPGSALGLFTTALVLSAVLVGWRKRVLGGLVPLIAGILVWTVSPAAAVHWAPSGEVFIVGPNGAVERIELVEGDGLAPLRFIDDPVTGACVDQICWRTSAGQQIALVPAGFATTCHELSEADLILSVSREPTCGVEAATWQDVQAANGQSWRVRDAVIRHVQRPLCGERPWNSCRRN